MYVCIYTHTYIHTYMHAIYIYIYVYTYMCIHTHTHTHTNRTIRLTQDGLDFFNKITHGLLYAHPSSYTHIHTYTHTHREWPYTRPTHKHTHTHTYIHTHTNRMIRLTEGGPDFFYDIANGLLSTREKPADGSPASQSARAKRFSAVGPQSLPPEALAAAGVCTFMCVRRRHIARRHCVIDGANSPVFSCIYTYTYTYTRAGIKRADPDA
jgi:hypothetical protein